MTDSRRLDLAITELVLMLSSHCFTTNILPLNYCNSNDSKVLILGFPIAVIVEARSTFVKPEAMLGFVETEEKDRILTASKTI